MSAQTVPDQAGFIDLAGIIRRAKASTIAGMTVGQARAILLAGQRAINQAQADALRLQPSWFGSLLGEEGPPGDARRAKVAASIAGYLTDIEGSDDSALWSDEAGWSPRVVTQSVVDAATEANALTAEIQVDAQVYHGLSGAISDALDVVIAYAEQAAAAVEQGAKNLGNIVGDIATPLVGIIPWYVWVLAAGVIAAPIIVPLFARR